MSFKTRPIRQSPPSQLLKKIKKAPTVLVKDFKKVDPKHLRYIWVGFLICFSSWVVFRVSLGAYSLVTDFKGTAKEIVFAVGTDLKTDKYGYTNIVLLGDGGNERAGAGLVDTIMVASIDHQKNAVTLLSIPRDYYVGKNGIGLGKMNEVYLANRNDTSERGGYAAFQEVLGKITNLDFHYFIRVDFNAFVEIVDSLGGITVEVERSIYDPQYPNATDTGYSPFRINAGVQEINGETALKFARSRHNQYGPSSDFDRAARQQLILGALQQKALSGGVLSSPSTLKKVYDAVQNNMTTNMGWRELVALGQFGDGFDRKRLVSKVLHNDRNTEGGFLGNGSRAVYGGYMLLPYDGNLDTIHRYADLIFHHREIYFNPPKIQIFNAGKTSGVAQDVSQVLKRFGFNVVKVSNYLDPEGKRQEAEQSMVFYYSWGEIEAEVIPTHQPHLKALETFIPFIPLPGNQLLLEEDVDLSLILGEDYKGLLSE